MNSNLKKAKTLFDENNYTCVFFLNDTIISSKETGVKPLIKLIDNKTDVKGFYATDKIIGRAAAFLYSILGVKEVYASVMSEDGLKILNDSGINAYYGILVKEIINRQNTGICPMDEAVANTTDKDIALNLIKSKIKEMLKK